MKTNEKRFMWKASMTRGRKGIFHYASGVICLNKARGDDRENGKMGRYKFQGYLGAPGCSDLGYNLHEETTHRHKKQRMFTGLRLSIDLSSHLIKSEITSSNLIRGNTLPSQLSFPLYQINTAWEMVLVWL